MLLLSDFRGAERLGNLPKAHRQFSAGQELTPTPISLTPESTLLATTLGFPSMSLAGFEALSQAGKVPRAWAGSRRSTLDKDSKCP